VGCQAGGKGKLHWEWASHFLHNQEHIIWHMRRYTRCKTNECDTECLGVNDFAIDNQHGRGVHTGKA